MPDSSTPETSSPEKVHSEPASGSESWRELYPFQSHLLDLNGLRYHFLDEGQGKPILMVHGNPTWSFYYRDLVLGLRDEYRCIVPDHIGCGLSDKPGDYEYRLANHVENLKTLIEALDLNEITLIAHDWGGAIGLGAAVDLQDRFSKIVLMNTAAFRDHRIPKRIAVCRTPGFGKIAIQGFNGFAGAALTMATEKPDRFTKEVKAGLIAPYNNWANRKATYEFVQDIPLSPKHPSYDTLFKIETNLHRLAHLPVKLIWGMKDWCFTPHFMNRFKNEFFLDAEVHEFEDCGHYVVEDAHERIIPIVKDLLTTDPVKKKVTDDVPAENSESDEQKTTEPVHAKGPIINIAQRLAARAAEQPDAIAIAQPLKHDSSGKRQYKTITYQELDQNSDKIARALREHGVFPGARLALMVPQSIEFITLTFALFKAGIVSILIDPGMGKKNVLKCLDEVRPDGFVGIPLVHIVRRIFRKRYPTFFNVNVGSQVLGGGVNYQSLLEGEWEGPELAETYGSDPAAIIFTTGSTGPPKGVLYRHYNFDQQVQQIQDTFAIKPGEVNLPGFPLFGLFDAAMGVTTILPDMDPTKPAEVYPPNIIEAMEDWNVNQAFGSPAMWNRIGTWCSEKDVKIPTLKRVFSAGAPVPPKVLEMMRNIMHEQGEMYTPYGATEALPVAQISASEVLKETAEKTNQGAGTCVGQKFSGIQWKVIKIVDGPITSMNEIEEQPANEIGELIVSASVVTSHYVNRPEANLKGKIQDGGTIWHRMGDSGYFDDQNRFWFTGRVAHRVKTSHGPLFTVPCEAIFNQHEKIFRSALVGVGPDPENQRPVMIVEPFAEYYPKSKKEYSDLISEVREIGSKSELVNGIHTFLVHKKFPVDIRHNSKIFREKLSVWATEYLRKSGI